MKVFFTLFLSFLLGCTVADKCAPITDKKVKELWKEWNKALQTLEPEKVSEMYHPHSVLLPTLSNKVRSDVEGKINYFEHFLAKKPVGKINEEYVNVRACNMATYNGIYTFDLTAVGKKAQARFSYVYTFEHDEWKIKTHHSSLMPEQAASHRRLREVGDSQRKLHVAMSPEDQKCKKVTAKDVRNMWHAWAASLATTPELVAEQYWNHGSVLLPTLSNQVRNSEQEKINYFEHFLQKKPVASINQDFVAIGCNTAEYNGIYSFQLTDPATKKVSAAMARFTYVFTTSPDEGAKGNWKIETHHSSLMPNPGGLSGIEDFNLISLKTWIEADFLKKKNYLNSLLLRFIFIIFRRD